MLGPDGSVIDTQAFDYDDVVGITGILAENGQLTARIAYADDTSEEIAAYTYDKTVAFSDAVKSPVSGPSDTSGEVLYSFNSSGPSIQDTQIAVSGFTDSFVHPDGYEFPDYQFGMILGSIREGAFKDAGPEQLGGHLKLGQFLTEIGAHAFENCTGISGDLDLTSVQETRDYAFYGCTGLDGKVILCPHRWVRKYAFAGCTGIRELENLETVNYIDEGGFKGCTALSGQYELCDWVVINDYAFMDCVNFDTTPVIKTQMIGESAFRNCAEMKGAKSLPKVGSIWSNAYMGSGVTRLEDLDALTDYLSDRFGQEKVIILGHSYGSMLGSRYVLAHPEKVSAYIGVGQCVNEKDYYGETYSYEDALKAARDKGDDTTEMEKVYEEFMSDKSIANLMKLRNHVDKYHPQTVTKDISTFAALTSPIAGVDDIRWYMVQIRAVMGDFSQYQKLVEEPLGSYMMDFNALDKNDTYQMPVLFLSGSCDWITPVGLVKEYADRITAPKVEVYLMEGCGHSPQGQLPEEFANAIKEFLK